MAKNTHLSVYILVTTAVVFGLYVGGIFAGLNLFFTDILYSQKEVKNPIVIVAIDDQSIQSIGQWPWKREVYGQVLNQLKKYNPKAVGIDVLFSEPSRYGVGDDQALAVAISSFPGRVILAEQAVYTNLGLVGSANTPLPIFSGERAHVNLSLDRDSIARKIPTDILIGGKKTQPLAYALIEKPTPSDARQRIAYRGGPGTIKTISFLDVWHGAPLDIPQQAYILIGATAESLHDTQATPLSMGALMSGVEIHAQIADSALSGDHLVDLGLLSVLLWIFILVILTGAIVFYSRRIGIALSVVALIFIANLVTAIVLFEQGTVVPIVYTSLAIILAGIVFGIIRYIYLDAEKRYIKNAFGKYVSEDVLKDILNNQQDIGLGGKDYHATILFSDIRGFTTLSEKMKPKALVHFLNLYLTQMTNIVLDNGGVIDKYIGDAIMAFWGAPIVSDSHAYQAILTTVAMVDSLVAFNAESQKEGYAPIAMGIGLNTGHIIAGNIGSDKRFDYTVIGDSVNLASRLESQTKQYGVAILISEFTLSSLSEEQKATLQTAGIRWRQLDRLVVKGKAEPVSIFEILGPTQAKEKMEMLASFEKIYTAYEHADWKECIAEAENHLAKWKDTPADILLERARHYSEYPTEWVGHHVAKTK